MKIESVCSNKHFWPSLILRESKETNQSHAHQYRQRITQLLVQLGLKTKIFQDN